jgi:hypothetical protein
MICAWHKISGRLSLMRNVQLMEKYIYIFRVYHIRIIAKKNWFTRHETDRFLNNHCQECMRAYLSIHDKHLFFTRSWSAIMGPKQIFPWKLNLECGDTFTKLFMHVSSRNMFPTTRNLQICVHVFRPRHYCGDWLTFGCVVGNIFRLETCMNSLVKVSPHSKFNFQGKIFFTQNWCNITLSNDKSIVQI